MKNTTRTVRLEGELGEKFGEVWHLNVQTPYEAIKAIECQAIGFRKHILDNAEKGIGYEVLIGDQGIKQEEELGYPAPMRDDFTFIPMIEGGKSRGFGMFLMGAALFALSGGASAIMSGFQGTSVGGAYLSGGTATQIGTLGFSHGVGLGQSMASAFGALSPIQTVGTMMGGALMAGGAAMMLAPTLESDAGNEEQSYLFDGAINSIKQGTPVPILYGRMIVGGAVISASIKSNQFTGPRTRNVHRRYVTGLGAGGYGTYTTPYANTTPRVTGTRK